MHYAPKEAGGTRTKKITRPTPGGGGRERGEGPTLGEERLDGDGGGGSERVSVEDLTRVHHPRRAVD